MDPQNPLPKPYLHHRNPVDDLDDVTDRPVPYLHPRVKKGEQSEPRRHSPYKMVARLCQQPLHTERGFEVLLDPRHPIKSHPPVNVEQSGRLVLDNDGVHDTTMNLATMAEVVQRDTPQDSLEIHVVIEVETNADMDTVAVDTAVADIPLQPSETLPTLEKHDTSTEEKTDAAKNASEGSNMPFQGLKLPMTIPIFPPEGKVELTLEITEEYEDEDGDYEEDESLDQEALAPIVVYHALPKEELRLNKPPKKSNAQSPPGRPTKSSRSRSASSESAKVTLTPMPMPPSSSVHIEEVPQPVPSKRKVRMTDRKNERDAWNLINAEREKARSKIKTIAEKRGVRRASKVGQDDLEWKRKQRTMALRKFYLDPEMFDKRPSYSYECPTVSRLLQVYDIDLFQPSTYSTTTRYHIVRNDASTLTLGSSRFMLKGAKSRTESQKSMKTSFDRQDE